VRIASQDVHLSQLFHSRQLRRDKLLSHSRRNMQGRTSSSRSALGRRYCWRPFGSNPSEDLQFLGSRDTYRAITSKVTVRTVYARKGSRQGNYFTYTCMMLDCFWIDSSNQVHKLQYSSQRTTDDPCMCSTVYWKYKSTGLKSLHPINFCRTFGKN
jgi:hypothetical protein